MDDSKKVLLLCLCAGGGCMVGGWVGSYAIFFHVDNSPSVYNEWKSLGGVVVMDW